MKILELTLLNRLSLNSMDLPASASKVLRGKVYITVAQLDSYSYELLLALATWGCIK